MSLFSGCGGLDLGFHEEGFQSIYAVDNDPAAIAVYRKNIGVTAWVRDVTSRLFHDEIRKLGRVDVVLGGFPCQGFSKAGPKNSADQRNTLYLEMLRAVSRLRPRIFVAENVDGLSQNFGGAFVRSITEDFAAAGYTVKHQIIDAVGFGVPQHRRIIFTANFVGLNQPTNFLQVTQSGSQTFVGLNQPTNYHAEMANLEQKIGEFDFWVTPSIADVRQTDRFKLEMRRISGVLDVLSGHPYTDIDAASYPGVMVCCLSRIQRDFFKFVQPRSACGVSCKRLDS